jgi:hypothetical protein
LFSNLPQTLFGIAFDRSGSLSFCSWSFIVILACYCLSFEELQEFFEIYERLSFSIFTHSNFVHSLQFIFMIGSLSLLSFCLIEGFAFEKTCLFNLVKL